MEINVNQQLLEHMMEPKNYGTLESADTQGIGKNPNNGEKVVIYANIDSTKSTPVIDDIRFQAIGCGTTIVAGSMITQEAVGLNFNEINSLVEATNRVLENVPSSDAVCTEMVLLALQAAIATYEERQKSADYPSITYYVKDNCELKEN